VLDNDRMSTIQERQESGKALREKVPHISHCKWPLAPSRFDPISRLQEHGKTI
jgi:hypothetical protein